jgi:AcrR family transcriptional regulator
MPRTRPPSAKSERTPKPDRRTGRIKRRPSAEATRERILVAAIDLFAERGYAATGIEALCQRARVVRTAIYWHFGSKEGVLVPVLERVASEWIEEIQKSVYLEGDPLARLDRFVNSLRDLVVLRPNLVRLLLAVTLERSEQDPATRDALRAIFERARAAIVQGIDDSLGAPYPESPLIARTALAFVSHAVTHQLVDLRPGEVDRVFSELRTAMLLIIGARLQEFLNIAPASEGSS